MTDDLQNIIDEYLKWLKDRMVLKSLQDNWTEITTPYLDRHNDALQIYVRKEGNNYFLTDDGYILNDLLNSGCSLDSPKRQELLKITLAGYGVQREGDTLVTRSQRDNFCQKKHFLLQAMMAVNDLFFVASPYINNIFLEDVAKWMDDGDVRYSPNISFTGSSGFVHHFDYLVPKSRKMPERIIQTVADPSKGNTELLLFKWHDTQGARAPNTKMYVVLNDQDRITKSVLGAYESYDITPILWSERNARIQELSA